jgi:Glycosyl hydrolase catalytic core
MATADGNRLTTFSPGTRRRSMAVHWYGNEFVVEEAVNTLKKFLEAVHHKFKLPIWLTEYSLIRWSDPPGYPSWQEQAEFAAKSVEMLERLPFVERYAWYSLPPWTNDSSETTALYYQNGEPTPVGSPIGEQG